MAITNPSLPQTNPNSATDTGFGRALSTLPSGATGAPNSDLQSFLTTNLDPYAQTIMGQYESSKAATEKLGAATAQNITDIGQQNLDTQYTQNKADFTGAAEKGALWNPGQLSLLQTQSDKRIRDLKTQINDALLNNNTQVAASLADLAVKENEAITNARTTFLNQYFSGKQEQRAAQSFQTPEQQAVLALAQNHPDAGISTTDNLADATNKVKNSVSYKQNISQGEANINQANAQAAQASSQAAQTNTLLSLINNMSPDNQDVQALKAGTLTPEELIQNNSGYGALGGAYAKAVLAEFQNQGGNVNQATLTATGQRNQVNALTGGSPWQLLGGLTYQAGQSVSRALTGTGGTPNAVPKGTDGAFYGFPGYVSDGTKWVKK